MSRLARLAVVCYLLLSGVYLIYWPHVDYFVDDWILMPQFHKAVAGGPSGIAGLAVQAVQNRIYGVYRMQWLSILYGFGVTWLGGYSAQFNFALLLLLHAANACLLCLWLARLGLQEGLAFSSGALFLLAPSTHWLLFTYLTNPFFVFSTFWILLMLWRLAAEKPRRGAVAACALCALFAGEQVFLLLWLAAPLAAWCFRRRWLRPLVPAWAALGLAGAVYVLVVTRISPLQAGSQRHWWTGKTLGLNSEQILEQLGRLAGLSGPSYYSFQPAGADLLLAAGAAALTGLLAWRLAEGQPRGGVRLLLLGLGGVLLAYGPTLWLAGGYPLRYHYTPSPFLAAALAALLWILLRPAWLRASAAGLLAAVFTLHAAAGLRQGWIPMATQHQLLAAKLRELRSNIAPGDLLIVAGTPFELGTAQHFSIHLPKIAVPFVESTTGVRPLEVVFDLGPEDSRWELFRNLNFSWHLKPADVARAHLLVWSKGAFVRPSYVAHRVDAEHYRLLPLKGVSLPPELAGAEFHREQLALSPERVYLSRSFAVQ